MYDMTKGEDDIQPVRQDPFRNFFSYLPIGANIFDGEGKVIAINSVARSYFGVSKDDPLTGYCLFEDPSITDDTKAKLRNGQSAIEVRWIDFEAIHQHRMYATKKAGDDRILIELTYAPFGSDLKAPDGYSIIIQDITERKQAEETLMKEQSLLKTTLESTADGILVVATGETWSTFNQKFLDMWGIPPSISEARNDQAALEHVIGSLANPEEFIAKVQELYKDFESDSFDTFELKDGRFFERFSMPQWLDQQVIGRVWSFRDITERRQAEAELAQSERDYRGLFDMAHDAIILFEERDEIVVEANQRACDLYGYSREEFIGMSLVEISTDKDLGKARVKEVSEKGHIKQFETIQKRKDGTKLYVEVNASRTNYQGNPVILSLNHDTTERKTAEEALAEALSLRELLLDIITHDLRNPASVIYALSEAARKDLPDNKFLKAIYTSSGRLMEVLNQTTILSQAAFGETIPKEALSLNTLLQEAAEEFASALSTAEMELVVAIAPKLIIEANPLIREVFKNYISNAIKYARDGKRIVIETVIEDQTLIVFVKDFGKTIAQADRDQIFQRKVQLENGKERGQGLGLAIVKRIAGAHGGEVWVEPNTPVGNSFCIRIPL